MGYHQCYHCNEDIIGKWYLCFYSLKNICRICSMISVGIDYHNYIPDNRTKFFNSLKLRQKRPRYNLINYSVLHDIVYPFED